MWIPILVFIAVVLIGIIFLSKSFLRYGFDKTGLSDEKIEETRKLLACFAVKAAEIEAEESAIYRELESKYVGTYSDYPNKSKYFIEISKKKRKYMDELEVEWAYKRIKPWVEKEACHQYVNEHFQREEEIHQKIDSLKGENDLSQQRMVPILEEEQRKIIEAKLLLSKGKSIEKVAQVFCKIGACHQLWDIERSILKEQFGVIIYSPAELNPDVIYD